ncbi:phage major capsid protein [Novipirellula artificiosorum]|uniref:Mu-like prophage major head subunit gpT n=1 Tax=Novipirellula artificiosorum TaxID=2528016 RepID=A0A5C6DQI1_9BACT|nr:hypothetical protein [Novipirellula artificiosorum]TWU37276.1 hypothetical protein Poly41_34050 [Novipirellula artificiosorum]
MSIDLYPTSAEQADLAAGLCLTAGLPIDRIAAFFDVDPNEIEPHSLADAAEIACGQTFRSDAEAIQAGFSSASLPVALSDVASAALFAGYSAVANQLLSAAVTIPASLTNFSATHGVSLDLGDVLEQLPASGEPISIDVSESAADLQLQQFAGKIQLSRQMIRNDTLGSLVDLALKMGAAARRTTEETVAAALQNSISYTATNAVTADLDAAGIQAASALLRGHPGDRQPTSLIVAPAQESAARALVGQSNNWSHLSLVVTNRVSAGKWYLAAKVDQIAAPLVLASLSGSEEPTFLEEPSRFNVLGSELVVYHATGCGQADPLAVVRGTVS